LELNLIGIENKSMGATYEVKKVRVIDNGLQSGWNRILLSKAFQDLLVYRFSAFTSPFQSHRFFQFEDPPGTGGSFLCLTI
jgi:hypothetical protein